MALPLHSPGMSVRHGPDTVSLLWPDAADETWQLCHLEQIERATHSLRWSVRQGQRTVLPSAATQKFPEPVVRKWLPECGGVTCSCGKGTRWTGSLQSKYDSIMWHHGRVFKKGHQERRFPEPGCVCLRFPLCGVALLRLRREPCQALPEPETLRSCGIINTKPAADFAARDRRPSCDAEG